MYHEHGDTLAMLIGTLEWNFRQTQLMLTYMMFAGFALALPRLEKERKLAAKRKQQVYQWMRAQYARRAAGYPVAHEIPRGLKGAVARVESAQAGQGRLGSSSPSKSDTRPLTARARRR